MIYFALPILILLGVRTTVLEMTIPGTDVISSHLSFYLYIYELIIAVITLRWIYVANPKNTEWLGVSIGIALIAVYLSSFPWMTFLHILRLVNLSGLFLFIAKTTDSKNLTHFLRGLSIATGFILCVAVIQLITQRSIGIELFHEAKVSVEQIGVAKIEIFGKNLLRPYSILPHPNIVGWLGVTIFSLLISLQNQKHAGKVLMVSQMGYLLLDHMHWTYPVVQYMVVYIGAIVFSKKRFEFKNNTNLSRLLVVICTGLVLLSFSRMAWGIFVALSIVYLVQEDRMFHVEHFSLKKYIGLIIIVPVLFFGSIWRYLQLLQETSLGLRAIYLQRSFKIIAENIWFGVGIGNYISALQKLTLLDVPTWQFEPVHNFFLLVFAELGIIGCGVVIIWIYVYKKLF